MSALDKIIRLHAPGKHEQAAHGRGGGGTGTAPTAPSKDYRSDLNDFAKNSSAASQIQFDRGIKGESVTSVSLGKRGPEGGKSEMKVGSRIRHDPYGRVNHNAKLNPALAKNSDRVVAIKVDSKGTIHALVENLSHPNPNMRGRRIREGGKTSFAVYS